jgi:hypothetical protein
MEATMPKPARDVRITVDLTRGEALQLIAAPRRL